MPEGDSRTKLFRDLITIARKMRTIFDARASAHGLTYSRARLLLHMSNNPQTTQSELADAMDVEPPTIARLLDGMQEAGLIDRTVSETDRRQRLVSLTSAARDHADDVQSMTEALRREMARGIPEADLQVAARVLEQVLRNLSETDPHA